MGRFRIAGTAAGAALVMALPVTPAGADAAAPGWRPVPLPKIEGENLLTDVAVFGKRDAWAVGKVYAADQTVILRWIGTKWTRVAGPRRDSFAALAVTGTSGSDVWVAGHCVFASGQSETPCASRWNGKTWTRPYQLPRPSIGTWVTAKAVSRNDVWIAGGQLESAYYVHWNGKKWSRVSAPASGAKQHYVQSLTSFGSNNVWAAGYQLGGTADQPLIQHWNGKKWSTVKTPATPGSSRLHSIVAIPGGQLWAVGQSPSRAVVMRYVKRAWVHAPRVPGSDTFATGVAGDGHGGVWVALTGAFPGRSASTSSTRYAHWNGAKWTLTRGGAHPGPIRSWHLTRVPGTRSLWAVGRYEDATGSHSYIEVFGAIPR
ncbi:hypothetical protein [Spirillospora sp. CA-294931]|uniref:hypothetical protein n=1 Tax=Spirillospora sp. CA-294931 TaxID=3240042 RepID=UPI003D91156E